ncbi:hypothetical protein [Noviherbaspirillum sp. ST9]|uniref:hypothetical protein n=1 Tax=Noviherbaspirillum sp. ST9 TaxID=3401606 RepID=UPI003B588D4F
MDLQIPGCALGLSARRLWEHTEFGQITPFIPIPKEGAIDVRAYIDVVNRAGRMEILTGLTLLEAVEGRHQGVFRTMINQLLRQLGSRSVRQWLAQVESHVIAFTQQRAVRNLPQPFLALTGEGAFGILGLHSALQHWLKEHGLEKANLLQWQQRISNLGKKGLRADELAFCGLAEAELEEFDVVVDGADLATQLHFNPLRLSILPVLSPAIVQLEFVRVPANIDYPRTKPKIKRELQSRPQWRDRVLGYSVDVVEWDDLLGPVRTWMAFTHQGEPVVSDTNPTGLCHSLDEARNLANVHAAQLFPKMSTQGIWSEYRLSGGSDYREWLVTLPYYAPSYFSQHFQHRNVLLHLRCDIREGAHGERVLLLQEVQSDWAQEARRESKDERVLPVPPWLQEWPALAMKLALLHAATLNVDALAWTPGSMQAHRYGGRGSAGLTELYDRTLPAEATRLLRRYGAQCGAVEVFQPENFYVEPAEFGYEVWDDRGRLLATADSWDAAQAALPDGAHETLVSMHGITLDEPLRQAILGDGFFAWGNGIH